MIPQTVERALPTFVVRLIPDSLLGRIAVLVLFKAAYTAVILWYAATRYPGTENLLFDTARTLGL